MLKKVTMGAATAALLTGLSGAAYANSNHDTGAPSMEKVGTALEEVYNQSKVVSGADMGKAGPEGQISLAEVSDDGFVRIDAVASGETEDLAATIEALGGRDVVSSGRTVSAAIPAGRLGDLSQSNYLAFAGPALRATHVGLTTSQGDRSMRSDIVKATQSLTGRGMTIGILSDSYACDPGPLGGPYTTPAEDIANGDVPANGVLVLSDFLDQSACIDEGRAMAQLIHDVVPDAELIFHTAFNGQADFAEGIKELAYNGADVIVDDVIYFAEPMFQDGVIAQAADEVARLGVPYYSSNGNRARDALQGRYRDVEAEVAGETNAWHDWVPGPGQDIFNTVTLDGSLQTNLALNWDSPNFSVSGGAGAPNDVDIIMLDLDGVPVPDCFEPGGQDGDLCQFTFTGADGGNGGDAIELVSLVDFAGGSEVQIGIKTDSGDAPGFFKYVLFGGGFGASEYDVTGSGSGYGHNNAARAEGVGASAFYFTEEFIGDPNTDTLRAAAGEPDCVPACLNDFSSAGGTPIFFNTDGDRLRFPRVRLKPGITGPDGGNTSFFFSDTSRDDDDGDGVFEFQEPGEFPNFFGTSAAAPHVAAVGALLLDSRNTQIQRRRGGATTYWMCNNERRSRGRNQLASSPAEVQSRIEDDGWVLGPCRRRDPRVIYAVKRLTAQDMTIRASNATGETVAELPNGFDFDSGFGFVDALAAIDFYNGPNGEPEVPDDE